MHWRALTWALCLLPLVACSPSGSTQTSQQAVGPSGSGLDFGSRWQSVDLTEIKAKYFSAIQTARRYENWRNPPFTVEKPTATPPSPREINTGKLMPIVLEVIDIGRTDPRRLLSFRGGKSAAFKLLTTGPLSSLDSRLWSLFFQTSVVYAAEIESTAPVVGIYDPLIDGWLIMQVDISTDAPRVVDLLATTGQSLRGDKTAGGTPDASDRTIPDVLWDITSALSSIVRTDLRYLRK